MARRTYSDVERASALAALDANGGNVAKTARDLDIPRVTLIEWRDGRVSDDVSNVRQQKKAELADRLENLAHTLIEAMPGKVGDASLQQVATSIGIAVDKMQLLRSKPTAISETRDTLTPDERAARIADLLERGRDRASTAVPDRSGAGGVRRAAHVATN